MDSNLLSEPPREQRYEVERLQEHQQPPTGDGAEALRGGVGQHSLEHQVQTSK